MRARPNSIFDRRADEFQRLGIIQRRFAEACELYRIAACLKDTSEQYVHGYFIAARQQRQTQAAL